MQLVHIPLPFSYPYTVVSVSHRIQISVPRFLVLGDEDPGLSFSDASETLSVLPPSMESESSEMALFLPASSAISTKPKPLARPVYLSVTIITETTSPQDSNSSLISSCEMRYGRLPTYSLLDTKNPLRKVIRYEYPG